jgi:hypothetical protein
MAQADSTVFLLAYITQVCSGPVLPETVVGFVGTEAYCDGNTLEATVSHALQLGMHCRDSGTELVTFGDLFVDCVGTSPQFGFYDAFGSSDSVNATRYTCQETATFAAGSTASQIQEIPNLAISTDRTWSAFPDKACYTLTRADGTLAPASFATSSPSPAPAMLSSLTISPSRSVAPQTVLPGTLAPSTSPPTPRPIGASLAPVNAPIQSGAPVAVAAPVAAPAMGTPIARSERSESSFPVGGVVGGAVAGLVLVSAIAFLACRTKARSKEPWGGSMVYKEPVVVAPVVVPNPTQNDQAPPDSRLGRFVTTREDDFEEVSDMVDQSAGIPVDHGHYKTNVASLPSPTQSQTTSSSTRETVATTDWTPNSSGLPFHNAPADQRPPPSRPVEFKDQARSVLYEVPMAHVQEVQPLSSPSDVPVTAVAQPTNASSSDSDRRRPLDP